MCEVTPNGYRINGEELKIPDLHPEDLPDPVRKELEKSPATQLDILFLRHNMHRNSTNIDKINKEIGTIGQKIDKFIASFDNQLKVEVTNGKKTIRPITELIAELWEHDTKNREMSVIKKFLKKHHKGIMFGAIGFFLANAVFRTQVHTLIDFIADHIADIFKWLF